MPENACIHQGSDNVVTVGDGVCIKFSIGVKKWPIGKVMVMTGIDRHHPTKNLVPCGFAAIFLKRYVHHFQLEMRNRI